MSKIGKPESTRIEGGRQNHDEHSPVLSGKINQKKIDRFVEAPPQLPPNSSEVLSRIFGINLEEVKGTIKSDPLDVLANHPVFNCLPNKFLTPDGIKVLMTCLETR